MKKLSCAPYALLINECQRGLLDKPVALFKGIADQAEQRAIVPRIALLAAAFRKFHQPVVFINVSHRQDFSGVAVNNPAVAYVKSQKGLCEGSIQVEPVKELSPQKEDHLVYRHSGMTAFYGNHLESLLHNLNVRTLVLAGVSTNVAIPGMLLGGLDRGYQIIVPEDCIAGASEDSHNALLLHLISPLASIVKSDELIAELHKSFCFASSDHDVYSEK